VSSQTASFWIAGPLIQTARFKTHDSNSERKRHLEAVLTRERIVYAT
jgi:hypothetical protein